MLECFIEFRREVVRRRTEYELRKARARAHILEGLTKAIDALDYIVTLIRNSRSVDEARQWLTAQMKTMSEVKTWKGAPTDVALKTYLGKLQKTMERLAFSEIQAQDLVCSCGACRRWNGRKLPMSMKVSLSSSRNWKRFWPMKDHCDE